jgi:hypothetical protein
MRTQTKNKRQADDTKELTEHRSQPYCVVLRDEMTGAIYSPIIVLAANKEEESQSGEPMR